MSLDKRPAGTEKMQRRATKFILKTDDNYETCLKKLNLMSLKYRRFLADVTFLYKALNGLCNINIDSYIQGVQPGTGQIGQL